MAKTEHDLSQKSQGSRQSGSWKIALRWIAIGLVLVALIIFYIRFPVCEQAVAGDKTVELCRKMTITDIPVIAAGVLIIIFAYPLFSEFSIFGVSLKRTVAENTKKTEKLEERVDYISMMASATASSELNIHLAPTPEEAEEAVESLRSEISFAKAAGDIPNLETVLETSPIEYRSSVAKVHLIEGWSQLEKYVYETSEMAGRTRRMPTPFAKDYYEQINVVRMTRNAVAHGEHVDEKVLLDAVEVAETLLVLAEDQ